MTWKSIALLAAVGAAGLSSAALARPQEKQVISVPGFADFLAVDGRTVWVTNRGRVEHWSRTGKLAEVPLAHPCGAMAVSDHALWVADCASGTLNRIDMATAKLTTTIPTGVANPKGELNVVAGAGSVWIASKASGTVARVDPKTNAVVATVTVAPGSWYMAFGYGALWVVSAEQRLIQKVDPRTDTVVASTPLGNEPGFLAAGAGAVWVQEQADGTLARIDRHSGALTNRIKVDDNLKWGDIDTGKGKVWLRTTDHQVFVVIDGKTSAIDARVGDAAGSGALRVAGGNLWTTAHDEHTLTWWPKAALKAALSHK